jgi:cobalt/nickel transport system permease protein
LLAVHIADGVLGWPWLLAGFLIAGALALAASWRVREEEVPRIALLAAAFFVASSIHVKLGPTSVHLLLNGLVGIVLGWRAPLAILLGVTLQALLIPHGGLSTIGVNAATEMIPALAAAALFPVLHLATSGRHSWARGVLVAAAAVVWGGCLVFAAAVLWTNPWADLIRFSSQAGLVLSPENLGPAGQIIRHPITLGLLAALAVVAVLVERRMENAPEFPLGAFLGVGCVLGTTALTGLVLVADSAERWGTFASVVFLAHLPLALLEGLILGCTVGFLARVKPEMLFPARWQAMPSAPTAPADRQEGILIRDRIGTAPLLLLALGALLLSASPALAHALEAECKVDRENRRVRVEGWYETGDAPKKARAKVLREDGTVLAEGALDANGVFVFTYEKAEPLRVQVEAPGGHRAECKLSAEELGGSSPVPAGPPTPSGEPRSRWRDLVVGLGFLLALAAFVLSWLNARQLRRLVERVEQLSVRT